MSECQCPIAGYCERYSRPMIGSMHQNCQSSQVWRDSFDKTFLGTKPVSLLSTETKVEPCKHRGEKLRKVVCQLCGGNQWKIIVFQCSLYQECTEKTQVENLKVCSQCLDYVKAS